MIEFSDVNIDAKNFRISADASAFRIRRDIIDFVNDLAEKVEQTATEIAPRGETGRLKSEGVIRTQAREGLAGDGGVFGSFVTEFPAIGGGFSIRGGNPRNRGQFSGVSHSFDPGHKFTGFGSDSVFTAEVFLNPLLKHAVWVHNGTGIYGPRHTPIVPKTKPFLVFYYMGRKWVRRSVKGQRPQPFLTQAFELVNNVYTPLELADLRAQIKLDT